MKIIVKIFFALVWVGWLAACSVENPATQDKPDTTSAFTGVNIFIGDSHVQGWDLKKSFPGKKTENHGMSGQFIIEIIPRLEKFPLQSDDNCFIIAGTNDFARLARDDKFPVPVIYSELLKRYDELLTKASSRFKNVYMISLLPIGAAFDCDECKIRHSVIPRVNDSLRKKCLDFPNIRFINMQQHLVGADSLLKSIYTHDGIHIEPNGYHIFNAEVRPYVR